jgi:ABC-2 type transport system ATP-binding protein
MREVRDLLVELVRGGTTVFLSSHLLAEVELVCTRAAIVARGRLVAQDRVDALLGPTGRVLVTTPDVAAAADLAAALPGVRLGERRPDRLAVHLDGTAPEALNRRLVDGGVRVRELVVERPTLEDVFLRLTGGLTGPPAPDPQDRDDEQGNRVPG